MKRTMGTVAVFSLLLLSACTQQSTSKIWLDEMGVKAYHEGIPSMDPILPDSGRNFTIGGKSIDRGILGRSIELLPIFLDGNGIRFSAIVGARDGGPDGEALHFYVVADKKVLYESKPLKVGDAPEKIDVDLHNVKRLGLLMLEGEGKPLTRKTHGIWANAYIEMKTGSKPAPFPNDGERYILTPPKPATPEIHSPAVFGARPGNPFLFTIAATGERPMQFSVKALPAGLHLDPATGLITGSVKQRGEYKVVMAASNAKGTDTKECVFKIGDAIALTPPMGWNGWNSWAKQIDQEKVVSSAKAMVDKGLRDHGWTYVNIDDTWEAPRGGKYMALQPNEKFPRFKEMADFIHSLGLKLGVYSTPWICTYAGYPGGSSDYPDGAYPDSIRIYKRENHRIGKYQFDTNDAKQFAEWGVDYLKYDWHITMPPAVSMSKALRECGRDILYSLSNSAPIENGADWARLANAYRTGPDIRDSWTGLYTSAFIIDDWAPYGGPGHWNDPDMMILGKVTTGSDLHPSRLTPDEQYAHMSIFSLLAAPLILGCPIEELDSFTLNLLTNDEVIAINQDPLGKPARLTVDEDGIQAWVKPMADGSYAVGWFNIDGYGKTPQSYFHWGDEKPREVNLDFSKIGLKGKWKLRNVWTQKDLGEVESGYKTSIPHHGVFLARLYPSK